MLMIYFTYNTMYEYCSVSSPYKMIALTFNILTQIMSCHESGYVSFCDFSAESHAYNSITFYSITVIMTPVTCLCDH